MKTTTTSPSRLDRSPVPSVLFGHAAAGAALVMIGYFLAILRHFEWILGAWSTPFVLMVVVAVMVMVLLTVRREEGELVFGRAFGLRCWPVAGASRIQPVQSGVFPSPAPKALRPTSNWWWTNLGGKVFGLDAEALEETWRASFEQALWSLSPLGRGDALTAIVWVASALIVSAILKRPPESESGLDA